MNRSLLDGWTSVCYFTLAHLHVANPAECAILTTLAVCYWIRMR